MIQPSSSSMWNRKDTSILCQEYLNLVYQGVRGNGINDRQKKNIPEKYGEILYDAMTKLFFYIPLSEHDVFIDLGSGLGKVVLQIFLNSVVKESCGIEIIPELHQQSLIAAKKVELDLPDFYTGGRKLRFELGSFFAIPLDRASVVLISSPCFSPTMFSKLGKIIDSLPHIHSVITLRPIPTLKRLLFKKAVRIECSWDTALGYIYRDEA